MPADQACQLMTVDVSQAIMNTAGVMCQASADICMQAFQMMSNEASKPSISAVSNTTKKET